MSKYKQNTVVSGETRFTDNPLSNIEFSKFRTPARVKTTFDGGDFTPILCLEVLPHDTFKCDLDFVIRQLTSQAPVMDNLIVDIFCYEVPNRVVNQSWKNVMGENSSGKWIAPSVDLVPLVSSYTQGNDTDYIQIPKGSVADHYDFPTQAPISKQHLMQCHDLKFRGYLEVYNNYIRDQNYQPPIPYSKLNVPEGFFELPTDTGKKIDVVIGANSPSSGQHTRGALVKSLYGEGSISPDVDQDIYIKNSTFSALDKPLKANKLHDYFTSVLPSPLKGREVQFNFAESAPVAISAGSDLKPLGTPLRVAPFSGSFITSQILGVDNEGGAVRARNANVDLTTGNPQSIGYTNLQGFADLSKVSGFTLSELRTGAAIQQIYESLARGGSRYREFIDTFFGLDINNPFDDIPTCIGHIRRELDLYQTAQTSATTEDSPQSKLTAFGYTAKGGHLFTHTFKEHGYLHIFAVVRHKNTYSTYLPIDNFRRSMLDFYMPQLANLSEQPVYTRSINPFLPPARADDVFGYQEAWAEYRYIPDRTHGLLRSDSEGNLDIWTYADLYDPELLIADGEWLQSNTAEVVAKTTATSELDEPQFKGDFTFIFEMERPMPVYSVPGMDIL